MLVVVRCAVLAIVVALASQGVAASADDLPDASLTPGAVALTDVSAICRPGYARGVRPRGLLWRRLKDAAYNEYHLPRGTRSTVDANGRRHSAYAIDHLIPLELGGSPTDPRNLWPEPIVSSKRKDRVENILHRRVCSGKESLTDAQRAIARDWQHAVRP